MSAKRVLRVNSKVKVI